MNNRPATVLVVDDEPWAGTYLSSLLGQCDDVEVAGVFRTSQPALDLVEERSIDLAFLDIEMPDIDGLTLAERIKKIDPLTEVVFTTGYEHYSLEAFKHYALGYLLKPCDIEDVRHHLDQARALRTRRQERKLVLKTFGRFDAFLDERTLIFSNAKAKELLALLADADGGQVSTERAVDLLWENHIYDESVKALYRRALCDLRTTLHECGADRALVRARGSASLDMSAVECDYHAYLQGKHDLFHGAYMEQYSWGEETLSRILNEAG